jgi:hypothetical protein
MLVSAEKTNSHPHIKIHVPVRAIKKNFIHLKSALELQMVGEIHTLTVTTHMRHQIATLINSKHLGDNVILVLLKL